MKGSGVDWLAIATLAAILLGPILAVFITRFVDSYRAAKERRLEIFRTLMRTRLTPVHPDHVGALNLVELEFIGYKAVIEAWRTYLQSLAVPSNIDGNIQEKRSRQLTVLLSKMADSLGIKVSQMEILNGNYLPQGWIDDDQQQRVMRMLLTSVLSGRTALHVRPDSRPESSPFPPPPNGTEPKG